MSKKRLYATITIQVKTSQEEDAFLVQQLYSLTKDLKTYLSNRSMSQRMLTGEVTKVKVR